MHSIFTLRLLKIFNSIKQPLTGNCRDSVCDFFFNGPTSVRRITSQIWANHSLFN